MAWSTEEEADKSRGKEQCPDRGEEEEVQARGVEDANEEGAQAELYNELASSRQSSARRERTSMIENRMISPKVTVARLTYCPQSAGGILTGVSTADVVVVARHDRFVSS